MKLVIVESPAKANTINKYLGSDYKVLASFGHVRDLPSKQGSVDPNDNFNMKYEVKTDHAKNINEILSFAKKAEGIVLASDPDREGEAIAWNIAEILRDENIVNQSNESSKLSRVTFNEITKSAVLSAMKNPRNIDMSLVDAQQARLSLDYLVGFTISPILWRKLPGSKSAGRVQSVALRIIVEREQEIERFVTQEFWSIDAIFRTKRKEEFCASLIKLNGKKIEKMTVNNEAEAKDICKTIESLGGFEVASIDKTKVKRNPYPPYNTSALQQDSVNRLGFTSKKTMSIAQRLYEGVEVGSGTKGLITYMRTDGVTLADSAIKDIRGYISQNFTKQYLPAKPIVYKSKTKNAQEAHEAIRPTDVFFTPKEAAKYLDKDQLALYDLIWKRTVACQMESGIFDRTTAEISDKKSVSVFRATGSVLVFDGFTALYKIEKPDDQKTSTATDQQGNDADAGTSSQQLPALEVKDPLDIVKPNCEQHFTQPPPRFSEASLIKKLEELGIGRPSTYSSIISVLQDREYVTIEKKRFIPQQRGRIVTAFLCNFFTRYVEYDFTANLENELDLISDGKMSRLNFLQKFWKDFNAQVLQVQHLDPARDIGEAIAKDLEYGLFKKDKDGNYDKKCPSCSEGTLSVKIGRYGIFLSCSKYPECKYTLSLDKAQASANSQGDGTDGGSSDSGSSSGAQKKENKTLGQDKGGNDVLLKFGPYGPYIEVFDAVAKKHLKRFSIPSGADLEKIDMAYASSLLSLPRLVGKHPESGKDITASIGRYGPYIAHDGKFVSIKDANEIFEIGINRAVDLIAQALEKSQRNGGDGGGRRSFGKRKADGAKKAKVTKKKPAAKRPTKV